MPRRSPRGGQELLSKSPHWQSRNSTGAGWAEENDLEISSIEGKASCWLLAVLANIKGSLTDRRHPKTPDRYRELFLRSRIFVHLLEKYIIAPDTNDERMPVEMCTVLKSMLTNLHEMPQRFERGTTWTPTAGRKGWMGATAFLALAECAAHSNLRRCTPTKLTFIVSAAALRRMLNTTICSWYKPTWKDPEAKVAIYAAHKDVDLFSRKLGAVHTPGMAKQFIVTPLQVAEAAVTSTFIHVVYDGCHYEASRVPSASATLHTS